jgi:hypothetical protein
MSFGKTSQTTPNSPMRRPQFSLKTLLWLMAVVAALFAGMTIEHQRHVREREQLSEQIDYLERTFVNFDDP